MRPGAAAADSSDDPDQRDMSALPTRGCQDLGQSPAAATRTSQTLLRTPTVPGPMLTVKGDSWSLTGPHFLTSLEAASDLYFHKTDSDARPTDDVSGSVPHG